MHKLNQFRLQVWHRGDLVKCVHPSVHPHVCGERCLTAACRRCLAGSSPRVWGTLGPRPARFITVRFIPTCVGNAGNTARRPGSRPVHPHVCGERNVGSGENIATRGSSPRVWGTRLNRAPRSPEPRFIPTCVGNAFAVIVVIAAYSVHPHVCGERFT